MGKKTYTYRPSGGWSDPELNKKYQEQIIRSANPVYKGSKKLLANKISERAKRTREEEEFLAEMRRQEQENYVLASYEADLKRQKAEENLIENNKNLYLANSNVFTRLLDGLFGYYGDDGYNIGTIQKDSKGNYIDNDGKIIPIEKVNEAVNKKTAKTAASEAYVIGSTISKGIDTALDQGFRGVTSFVPSVAEFILSGVGNIIDDTIVNPFRDKKGKEEYNKAILKTSIERTLGIKQFLNKITLGSIDALNNDVQDSQKTLENIYSEERKRGKMYQTGTEKFLDTVFDNGVDKAVDWFNDGFLFNQNQKDTFNELESIVKNRAIEAEGRKETKIFDESGLSPVSSSKTKVYNPVTKSYKDVNEERLPEGSQNLLDTQKLARNDDGSIKVDEYGQPVYTNKYSLGEKLYRSNFWDFITDKYNTDQVGDLLGNMAGFAISGRAAAGVAGKTTGAVKDMATKFAEATNLATRVESALAKTPKLTSAFGKIESATNKITSTKVGNFAARPVRKVFSKESIDTMLTSYLQTNVESKQIGQDAYNNVYNNAIDRAANIDTKQISEQVRQANPNRNEGEIELITMQKIQEARNDFESDPKNANIIKEAAIAGKQAEAFATTSNNTMAFLLNLTSAGLFVKKSSVARNILTNPYSRKGAIKALKYLGFEGLQEGFEEGFVNQIAQKAGEGFGEGHFSYDDYYENDLFSTESLEQGMLGAMMGIGQTGLVLSGGNLRNPLSEDSKTAHQRYKEQQEQIKQLQDLGALPPEQIKKLINHAYNVTELNKYHQEITQLEKEGKKEEADALKDRLLLTQSVRAATTGTSQVMTDTLTKMLENPDLDAETKKNISKSIKFNEMIADMHDKHSNYLGRNRILANRGTRFQLEESMREHEATTLVEAQKAYDEAVNRTIRKSIEDSKANMSESELEHLMNNYSDIFENKKSSFEGHKSNLTEYKDLMAVKQGLANMQETLDQLDEGYKNLTSDKFQKSYKAQIGKEITKKILNSVTRKNAKESKEQVVTQQQQEENPNPSSTEEVKKPEEISITNQITQKEYEKDTEIPTPKSESEEKPVVEQTPVHEELERLTPEEMAKDHDSNDDIMAKLQQAGLISTPQAAPQVESNNDTIGKEDPIEIEDEVQTPFNAPMEISDENKSNQIIDLFADHFSKGGTVRGVLGTLMNEDPAYADQFFDHIIEGYNKANPDNPIPQNEADRVYNQLFGKVDEVKNLISKTRAITPSNTPTTTSSPVPVDNKISNEVSDDTDSKEIIAKDPSTGKDVKRYKGYKTDNPDVRLSYLGQPVTLNEDGTKYENSSNEVNQEAMAAIHYDNFKPGDKVKLNFNWDYFTTVDFLNTYTQHDDGSVTTHRNTIQEFVENIFGKGFYPKFQEMIKTEEGKQELLKNKEFLQYMPTTTVLPDGTSTGLGISSNGWWNTKNVALEEGVNGEPLVQKQKQIIEEAKKRNMRLRESLASGQEVTLTVKERRDTFHNKQLPEDKGKFQSVLNAFKNDVNALKATVSFGAFLGSEPASVTKDGNAIFKINGKQVVLTDENSNISKFKASMDRNSGGFNGKVFMVYQSGYNSKGNPQYIIRGLVNNHASKFQQFKQQYDIIQQIRKYGNILNGTNTNFSNTEKEKAIKIAEFFKNKYNVNIADYADFSRNFAQYFPQKINIPTNRRAEYGNRNTYSKGDVITTPDGRTITVDNPFRQDFNITNKEDKVLPDLSRFGSVTEFESAVLSDGAIAETTAQEIFMNNVHTQFKFSEINDGVHEPIYTTSVQPSITFEDNFTQEERKQEKAKEIVSKKNQLQSNQELQEEINSKIENIKDPIEKRRLIREKSKLQQEEKTLKNELSTEDIDTNSTENEIENKIFNEDDLNTVNLHLMYNALKNINSKEFTRDDVLYEVRNQFEDFVADLYKQDKTEEADFLVENKDNILGTENYDGSVKEMIDTLFDINPGEEIDTDSMFEKDQTKESFEVDIAGSLSLRVKMLLSGIQDTRESSNNFAGIPEYFTFKDTIDFLQQALAESHNNSLEGLKEVVKQKIDTNPKEFGFYQEIYNRLENLQKNDQAFLNEIMYFLHQPKVDMTFMMYSQKENGEFVIQKYDANSKNTEISKRNKWKESLKTSPLLEMYENSFYRVNKEAFDQVKVLYNLIKEDRDKGSEPNYGNITKYFSYFGITLNPATLNALHTDKFGSNEFRLYGKGILGSNQIFELLYKNIDSAYVNQTQFGSKYTLDSSVARGHNEFEMNPLTSGTTSALKKLIIADNFMSAINYNSMRIAGKSINPFQMAKSITNTISKLKSDPEYIKKLNNTPITSESFIVEMLEKVPAFNSYFSVDTMSLEALKERNQDSRDDMGPTQLSDLDAMVTLFNLFAQDDGEIRNDEYFEKGIKLRKGSMVFPTLSDSSQQPILNTIVVNLTQNNFTDFNIDTLHDNIVSFIVDKTVKNELKRIAAFTKANTTTNVKGHDAGAGFINSIISLNTMLVDSTINVDGNEETVRRPLSEVFKKHKSPYGQQWYEDVDGFIENYKEDIYNEIRAHLKNEVDQIIKDFTDNEMFIPGDAEAGTEASINRIDNKYLTSKGGLKGEKLMTMIAYDYAINNLITLNEIQNLFAGDTANYFKDKHVKGFEFGMPKVTVQDIADFYYDGNVNEELIKALESGKVSPENLEIIKREFPKLLSGSEISMNSVDEIIEDINPIARLKMVDIYKDVQNNLSKRLKELISPGSRYPNSMSKDQTYYQIMLQDIENSSEVLHSLAKQFHPDKYEEMKDVIDEFKRLDDIYPSNRNKIQQDKHDALKRQLEKNLPEISGFLKNASTDAQEYATWQDNLNQLRNQGRVTQEEFDKIFDKLTAQAKDIDDYGYITEQNRWKDSEKDLRNKSVMQVSKPLYSGHHLEEVNGYNMSRYIYIKSSSFPLTPELTAAFPKLNNMRKNMEKWQEVDPETRQIKTTIRASYDSANKVGAVKGGLPINELYKENPNLDMIGNNSVELYKENFFIQQDKPFKSDKNAKNGKRDEVTRATQFEKILLGDGINKITDPIFDNIFDKELLDEFGIEAGEKLNGPQLKQIYDKLYEKEQKLLTQKFNEELGITSINDIANGKPEVLKNIIDKLRQRLSNKQDSKMLSLQYTVVYTNKNGKDIRATWSEAKLIEELNKAHQNGTTLPVIERAQFMVPLYMMPNSNKFESVLNSIINKSNINLKMSGFSSPVASQEGFDFKGFKGQGQLEQLKKQGLVTTKNFDPSKGLQATKTEDGKLKYAQVFIANKFKTYNEQTGKYEYINLQDYVDENGQIDTNKLPEELLSMFSFRIPTSSHQSGVIIEVAGFLPHTSGDLMIVPKDHTTQIGEDYDIDTRYVYQYNYFKDKNGNLKKMSTEDLSMDEAEVTRLKEAYNSFKESLDEHFYETVDGNRRLINPAVKHNRETLINIASLESLLDNWKDPKVIPIKQALQEEWELEDGITRSDVFKKISDYNNDILPSYLVGEVRDSMRNKYKTISNKLKEEYNNRLQTTIDYYRAKNQKMNEHKVIENNLISLYKSVFSSADTRVQKLINKKLSTDNAENTAEIMDKKLNSDRSPYYSFHSAKLQRDIIKLGASGKIGIGEHSNAVTMNSILQQSNYVHSIFSHTIETKEGDIVQIPFNIVLGNQLFDGRLGKVENNGVRVSELGMEDQNSATDNQKLQIMGKRNEDKNTMSVLKILHASGIDNDMVNVNGQTLSYASLFINQPIIRRYSKLVNTLSSASNSFKGNPKAAALAQLELELEEKLPDSVWKTDKLTGELLVGELRDDIYLKEAKKLDSKELYNQLLEKDSNTLSQYIILKNFANLQRAASTYNDLQRVINIERNGMGLSYFDVIDSLGTLMDVLNGDINITNSEKMIGEHIITSEDLSESGYIPVVTKEMNKDVPSSLYYDMKNGETLWIKPNNHYSHKIVNSIALGYNTYNSLFPYNHSNINNAIKDIMDSMGIKTEDAIREEKYKIVQSLKDYIYTNNSALFDGNVNKTRQNLFFDTANNESLATYLLKLQNNTAFKDMFRKPFFRDLQFEINAEGYPSIIKFNNSDISKVNTLAIYNNFEKMMRSNKNLPSFNGKVYNEQELMKDLLKYALLADQGNGAIGFRQHLPVELFEKHGVITGISNVTNINSNYQSIAYHGPMYTLQKQLVGKLDDFGVININNPSLKTVDIENLVKNVNSTLEQLHGVKNAVTYDEANNKVVYNLNDGRIVNSDFVRQYLQHNADKVKSLRGGILNTVLGNNSITLDMITKGEAKEFFFIDDTRFLTIKDNNGKTHLYEKVANNFFKEIPTLGVFGMREYNNKQEQTSSQITKNNPIQVAPVRVAANMSKVYSMLNSNVATNFESFLYVLGQEDYAGQYAPLFKLFRNYVNFSNINIVKGPEGNYSARYKPSGVIEINPKLIENYDTQKITKKVAEEMIHHVTVNTIGRFVEFTGFNPETRSITYKVVRDENGNKVNVPAEVINLIAVYNTALRQMAKKHGVDSIVNTIQNSQSHLGADKGAQNDLYRVSNIHEFIAGIFMKNEAFAKEMANTPYKNTGKSILEKFTDALAKFFYRVIPSLKTETVSGQVASELFKMLSDFTTNKKGEVVKSNFKLIYDTPEKRKAFSKSLKLIDKVKEELTSQNEDRINQEALKQINNDSNTSVDAEINSTIGNERSNVSKTINVYAGTGENADLSNFAIRPFTINVELPTDENKEFTFQSVEQAFQFYKAIVANDPITAKKIMNNTNGAVLKSLGRSLKMTKEQLEEWDNQAKSVMLNLMYDSFSQNSDAAKRLINTGDAIITHNQDRGRWKKDFPEVMMTVREMLKEEGFGLNSPVNITTFAEEALKCK